MFLALLRFSYLSSILFLTLFSPIAFCLQKDINQPFNIVANTSIFNYKTGIDIYEGEVKIDQGTTHLTADRLITQKNKQHKIILATAMGIKKLAEYTTVPSVGDALLYAKARIIKFYPDASVVILEKDVIVTQKGNSFHGPLIIYNIKDQVVTAPASKDGRATIVIEPEQLS
ncbi:MAG: lptA [Gammaproteobacteria bacterium]|jgi:lipopolysaccharide export system protein LptA|nr:lptA [Gammaproteobacteria bacterium]